MNKIKEYIDIIVDKGNSSDMKELAEMMVDVLDDVEYYDCKRYNKYKECLYELANGKELSEDIAIEWVKNMKPIGEHWTIEETNNAMSRLGYTFNRVDFYVVMNMIYNDYYDVVKEDDNLTMKIAIDWLTDEDAKEHKLYEYWKHVINREE